MCSLQRVSRALAVSEDARSTAQQAASQAQAQLAALRRRCEELGDQAARSAGERSAEARRWQADLEAERGSLARCV